MSQATESDSVCVVYSVTSYLQSCRNCRWKKCIILCWTLRWRVPLGFLQPEQPSSLMSHMRETSRICMRRVTPLDYHHHRRQRRGVWSACDKRETDDDRRMDDDIMMWCHSELWRKRSEVTTGGNLTRGSTDLFLKLFVLSADSPTHHGKKVQVSWFPIVVSKGFQITCKQWGLGGWAAILPLTQNN